MALSEKTIATVKSTVPVLEAHGTDIVMKFYEILFTRYPDVKTYFNIDRQKGGVSHEEGLPTQVTALARAVMAYAKYIDKISVILPVVRSICHKHVSRGVEAIQYSAVGECLLSAMSEVLGLAATDEVLEEWKKAFVFLSKAFIDTETELHKTLSETAGFSGMVPMRVVAHNSDGKGGMTMGLRPVHYAVPPVGKGQFVAIELRLDNGARTTTSMYCVEGPEDRMTIQVPMSKERATTALMDSRVGTILSVSMPCGDIKS